MSSPTLTSLLQLSTGRRRARLARQLEPLLSRHAGRGFHGGAVAEEAVRELAGELDQPLAHVVRRACESDGEVGPHCRRAGGHGDRPVTATLGQQTVSHSETARVELETTGLTQLLLELTLTVELAFTLLKIDIVGGRVVKVHPSEIVASATLTADGVELCRREDVAMTLTDRPARSDRHHRRRSRP